MNPIFKADAFAARSVSTGLRKSFPQIEGATIYKLSRDSANGIAVIKCEHLGDTLYFTFGFPDIERLFSSLENKLEAKLDRITSRGKESVKNKLEAKLYFDCPEDSFATDNKALDETFNHLRRVFGPGMDRVWRMIDETDVYSVYTAFLEMKDEGEAE